MIAGPRATPTAEWVAAMLRNYLEDDEVLKEAGSVVVQAPGNPTIIFVIQHGGDHLLVQVNNAEVVPS